MRSRARWMRVLTRRPHGAPLRSIPPSPPASVTGSAAWKWVKTLTLSFGLPTLLLPSADTHISQLSTVKLFTLKHKIRTLPLGRVLTYFQRCNVTISQGLTQKETRPFSTGSAMHSDSIKSQDSARFRFGISGNVPSQPLPQFSNKRSVKWPSSA